MIGRPALAVNRLITHGDQASASIDRPRSPNGSSGICRTKVFGNLTGVPRSSVPPGPRVPSQAFPRYSACKFAIPAQGICSQAIQTQAWRPHHTRGVLLGEKQSSEWGGGAR